MSDLLFKIIRNSYFVYDNERQINFNENDNDFREFFNKYSTSLTRNNEK